MRSVLFFDRGEEVVAAYENEFRSNPYVRFEVGNVEDINADLFVSPANSFGEMVGGIDGAYAKMWPTIQDQVQDKIEQWYDFNEVPVGEATTISHLPLEKFDKEVRLIVAPTMRTPATDLRGSVNVYQAMRAICDYLHDGTLNEVVAIPGLGTNIGMLPPALCARQVKAAYEERILGIERKFTSGAEAKAFEQWLMGNG